tara:strand:- start:2303 stop:3388 length:1086 start_codon:yes stop_codon:yes gene_type:complete
VKNIHKNYLLQAHSIAEKQFGKTFPNPSVGCIIVKKNKIIAKSATGIRGRPHAEELALKKIGKNSKDSTMYVTLEPCYHKSKKGSCAEQIIKAGIKKIYIAKVDPDPRTNSKSINLFKKFSVKINLGITSKKTDNLNNFFFKSTLLKRPYIKVKMAVSKDYKISREDSSSKWISNKDSRLYSHFLRSQSQALLTTAKTIIEDNPRLTVRQKDKKIKRIPVLIIDKYLDIPITSKIIKHAKKNDIIIFSSIKNKKYLKLRKLGCKIFLQKLDNTKNFNLKKIMKTIYYLNINNIIVESGGVFFTNLIKNNLVDEFHLFKAPFKIGKKGKPLLNGLKLSDLNLKENKRKYFLRDKYQLFYLKN